MRLRRLLRDVRAGRGRVQLRVARERRRGAAVGVDVDALDQIAAADAELLAAEGPACVATAQAKPSLQYILVSGSQSLSCWHSAVQVARKVPPSALMPATSPVEALGGCSRQRRDGHSSAGELTCVPLTAWPPGFTHGRPIEFGLQANRPAPTTPASNVHRNRALIPFPPEAPSLATVTQLT